jgi:two-component system sensor histidine kinase VanS
MKRKNFFGIYAKVLSYTLLILLAVVIVAALFLSNQITEALKSMEYEQLSHIFLPLREQLDGKSDEEVIIILEEFYSRNTAFEFYAQNEDGEIIYKTPGAIISGGEIAYARSNTNDSVFYFRDYPSDAFQTSTFQASGISLYASGISSNDTVYKEFIQKTLIALLLLFLFGGVAASVFAYRITKPIKILARNTKRMSKLEFVTPPIAQAAWASSGRRPRPARSDEIGQLADDVYAMYEKLKTEIEREREMEESQRYFFSAASHELKTPIASTLILLQGMFDNIGDYKDHPKYLLECIKKMKIQSKMISEILEIVRLSDGTIIPTYEKIEISEAINSVAALHQTLTESKEQRIIINVPEITMCKADRVMLNRVLSNIFLNAIQNTPERGEIIIWHEKIDTAVRLHILNKGAKIDVDTLSNAFEPFYREDKARSSEIERTGLGLAIVKKTLDCMGFDFSLENTDDGVCFWIDLPAY